MSNIKKISAEQFRNCQNDPAHCVIDVRNREEYAAGSEASCCWPLGEINAESVSEFVKKQKINPDNTIVLLCARGMRAQQAAEKLRVLLPNPISVVEGGHAALQSSTQRISIDRQVRIAAGSLVLIGIITSFAIHPAAIALSAFVACGLIFGGITDWCGMGLLIMKMPWNKNT